MRGVNGPRRRGRETKLGYHDDADIIMIIKEEMRRKEANKKQ